MARFCDFTALRCILVILNTFYIVSNFSMLQICIVMGTIEVSSTGPKRK